MSSEPCFLCPRNCGADRVEHMGFCRAPRKLTVARAMPHYWEEPILSGSRGSGTIFFSGCTMACRFCQNIEISQKIQGRLLENDELAVLMLDLEQKGCHNINLVTGDHYIPEIAEAIKIARGEGLSIPIAFNTSSYIKAESLRLLDGLIETYLADLKYCSDRYSLNFSRTAGYFDTASQAIAEMYRQRGAFVLDEDGMLQSGLVIRHLALPGLFFDSKKIIQYVSETYGNKVFFSLMNQYTPMNNVTGQLARRLSPMEYEKLLDLCQVFDYGFAQGEPEEDESFYIPSFNGEGVRFGQEYKKQPEA